MLDYGTLEHSLVAIGASLFGIAFIALAEARARTEQLYVRIALPNKSRSSGAAAMKRSGNL